MPGLRRLAPALLLAVAVALAGPAAAHSASQQGLAPYNGAHPVEAVHQTTYYGLRLMGMGGAFTAVAEGAEGIPTTLASLANRRPDQGGSGSTWDLDLSWVIPANYLDVDNDGCGAPSGMRMLAFGGLVRFGRLGVGIFYDAVTFGAGGSSQPTTEVLRPSSASPTPSPGTPSWSAPASTPWATPSGDRASPPSRPPATASPPTSSGGPRGVPSASGSR